MARVALPVFYHTAMIARAEEGHFSNESHYGFGRSHVRKWPAAPRRAASPFTMDDSQEEDSICPTHGHHARPLTEEEADRLRSDTALVSPFQREKLEREAKRNWDLFYKRNTTHFFKVAVMILFTARTILSSQL